MHQVCTESYAVWYMDECSMTGVFQTGLYRALTALCITCMTSLTWILLVYFVTTIAFDFPPHSTLQTANEHVGYLAAWCGFETLPKVRSTLEHAQLNYHVTQFDYWIQETLTRNKIGTQITFHRDMTSKVIICVFVPLLMQERSRYLRPNLISICQLAWDGTC